jgi:hypothetical protein
MAVKTFTTGEVLTAADTNTYLANAGLDYVKQVTVGSAVASVDVTSCFSSTYDNYRVIYSNINPSTNNDLNLTLLATTTPSTTAYYRGFVYVSLSTGAVTGVGAANTSSHLVSSVTSTSFRHAGSIDLFMPFLAQYTGIAATSYIMRTDIASAGVFGSHQVASSYDGIRLTPSSGTLTGGTITVYGYRKG